ncbi:MAG: ATP-binding cassette domain-containing protein, partial [Acidobacteriota bacterium]
MSMIALNSVSFQYESSPEPVFTDLTLSIDTAWKTGLVGRNGRGKSTLLSLISGAIEPAGGSVERPVPAALFPMPVHDPGAAAHDVIRRLIAPYREWEAEMERLLKSGREEDLSAYGEIAQAYERHHGYTIDAMIERECAELGLGAPMLARPVSSLSGGEQTRLMIAALFLKTDAFPLLDEPTNHLDMNGRSALADYLSHKNGFIVVSHDRSFLDGCCDHIVSLNRSDLRIFPGNYTAWNLQMRVEEETERARSANLAREITALEKAARRQRTWSAVTEKEKKSAPDSGFVSHKAAKMMKRALSNEQRVEKHLEEKKTLLKNAETVRPLIMSEAEGAPDIVLSVENIGITIGGRPIIRDLSFTLRRGERLALIGDNGSGKTTLLRMLRGELQPESGAFHIPRYLEVAHGLQHPLWASGMLHEHLRHAGIDETRFRIIMGAFGIQGDIFDRPLETFS